MRNIRFVLLAAISVLSLQSITGCSSSTAPGNGTTPYATPQALHVGSKYLYEDMSQSSFHSDTTLTIDSVASMDKTPGGRTTVLEAVSYFSDYDSSFRSGGMEYMGYAANGNYMLPLFGDPSARWIELPTSAATSTLTVDTSIKDGSSLVALHIVISSQFAGSQPVQVGSSYLNCVKVLSTWTATRIGTSAPSTLHLTVLYSPDLKQIVSLHGEQDNVNVDGTTSHQTNTKTLKQFWN